jgi:hypothetical protein
MTPFLYAFAAIGALCVACMVAFLLIALFSIFASARSEYPDPARHRRPRRARMWGGTTERERHKLRSVA